MAAVFYGVFFGTIGLFLALAFIAWLTIPRNPAQRTQTRSRRGSESELPLVSSGTQSRATRKTNNTEFRSSARFDMASRRHVHNT
jgi:hypothetical protein